MTAVVHAPGRVNLLGEHTDYNDGFVLPIAINRFTTVEACDRSDDMVTVEAADLGESDAFRIDLIDRTGTWRDYVRGVVRAIEPRAGADLRITSTLPRGAGLSSSAALEVAVGRAFSDLPGPELAILCRRAENEFVGVQCGIMDQFTVANARAGRALLLDCRDLGGFNWSSQHLVREESMRGLRERQLAVRAMRGQMWSPGRPSTARREDRVRFWEAIARGATSEDAAVATGVSKAVGSRWFRQAGGMPPISLAPLSGRYLSFPEREEIAILHAQDHGVREIARRVGRSPSTVSRELRRNASTRSNALAYRATTAQWHAERRASRPKVARLAAHDALREYVQDRLAGVIASPDGELVPGPDARWSGRRHGRRRDRRWARSWSPEQISNRLRIDFPDDQGMRISHEAIYQALYVQGRGALKRELVACLRTGRALRVPQARTRGRGKKFVTAEVMIIERPAEATDRAVPGHWEGDLILGLESSAIGTLVERTTRFTMLLHLPRIQGHGDQPRDKNGPALTGHGAEAVRDAIAASITTLPEQLRRSLAWDQGAEMAQHVQLRIDTGLQVYFCDPQSPWQRGTNENTNGLLRQYFPRGTDLSRHSSEDLAAVAAALNSRPRKTLGWRTPAEEFDRYLESSQQPTVATTG